jgi:hypothetical protein
MEHVAQRGIVHRHANAPVRLGLAVEGDRVGALRDDHLGHEVGAEAGPVVDPGRTLGQKDGFAPPTAKLFLDVQLTLDAGWDELEDLGALAFTEGRELMAAALRAAALLLRDLVLDASGGQLASLLRVLSSRLLGGSRIGRDARVAQLVRDPRHLLGALAEHVTLELLETGSEARELGSGGGQLTLELLDPLPPRTVMVVAAHP